MFLLLILKIVTSTMTLDESIELSITDNSIPGNDLESQIVINGVTYNSICECQSPELTEETTVKCAPTQITLTQEIENPGASIESVQEKLQTSEYTFVNVAGSSFRCIDGRITSESLGALGGDLGEFGLGLLVYEDLSGKRLTESDILLYLTEYLEYMQQNKFYWCSDDIALGNVQKQLGVEGINFLSPRSDLQDELLQLLTQPSGIGDLHVKNLIKYPEKYSVRPQSIELLIKAFFTILWNPNSLVHDYLFFEILPGNHNETGFLEIRTLEECFVEQIAPLIVPRQGGKDNLSLFVHHLDAVNLKRNEISLFFAEIVAKNQDGITSEKFLSRMKHHGLLFLDVTGEIIAGDLPFFSAKFENE